MRTFLACGVGLLALSSSTAAQCESFRLGPPPDEVIGSSVDVGSKALVVGAGETGKALVYALGRNGPQLRTVLEPPDDLGPADDFGAAVAIDGSTIVVTRPLVQEVHVFEFFGGLWVPTQVLTPGMPQEGSRFGHLADLAGDVLVVSAHAFDGAANGTGSVYVFERSDGVWSEAQRLWASDGAEYDLFGTGLACEGGFILVGAVQDDDLGNWSGSAYVFEHDGNRFRQRQKLHASDGAMGDFFGDAIAVGDGWAVVTSSTDNGSVGSNQGAAYVFERLPNRWVERAKLTPSNAKSWSFFGDAIAMHGDRFVISAPNTVSWPGDAYVFERRGATWSEIAHVTGPPRFGSSVALHGDVFVAARRDLVAGYELSSREGPGACPATSNSTGQPAVLVGIGPVSISDDDFRLRVTSCPPDTTGRFFYGRVPGVSPLGSGVLCIRPVPGSIFPLGDFVTTDEDGAAELVLDFSALAGSAAILPGERWQFQFAYEDPMDPPDTTRQLNFSTSWAVTFCP